jgi:hypothetical protein
VTAVDFAPDGKLLASGSLDTTALLWDLESLLQGRPPRKANLLASDWEAHWTDLAGEDAPRAHRAVWALAAASERAVPLIAAHLRPVQPVDPERIARLLGDLDSDEFTLREKATRELEQLGAAAEPALRKALAENPSLELRRRMERLLERLAAEHIRGLRVLEVLEHAGTPEDEGAVPLEGRPLAPRVPYAPCFSPLLREHLGSAQADEPCAQGRLLFVVGHLCLHQFHPLKAHAVAGP